VRYLSYPSVYIFLLNRSIGKFAQSLNKIKWIVIVILLLLCGIGADNLVERHCLLLHIAWLAQQLVRLLQLPAVGSDIVCP